MAKAVGSSHPCRNCGAVVVKAVSNAGKTYTASVVMVSSRFADHYDPKKAIYPAHSCDPLEAERYQKKIAQKIENGEIIKGQRIEVIKGRKVPKGVSGVVFWVSYQTFNGSEILDRVGFKSDDGTTYFISAKNVQAITNQ